MPSAQELAQWQSIGSPKGPGGFPAYNQIYNIYGNSGAAGLRNAQIGNSGGGGAPVSAPTLGLPTSGTGGASASNPWSNWNGMATPGGGSVSGAVQNQAIGSTSGVGGYSAGAPPDLGSLTQMINNLNLQGQQASNAGRIPGSAGLEAQSSQNIGSELGGNVPVDVQNLLAQQAAERGVGMGSPGSANSNSAYLRALGLTSLQQQQQGQANLSSADARNPGAPLFNPTSMLLNPAQAGQLNAENARLGLDWYKALNPGQNGGSGQRGGQQPAPVDSTGGGGNWFSNLMGGTPSSSAVAPPPSVGQGFTQDPNYPGTSVPGLPNLTGILGTQDPGYGLSPDPYGQAPPFDASQQSNWDFTGGSGGDLGGFDPFQQYGGG
jgi:hypothetical protein